jgi:bifunctional ADP-heptose synthase (sugar kinase/adenylyltransferase)
MNADELARFTDGEPKTAAVELAQKTGKPVFVSVAENGILCANPNGEATHSPALPARGAIDIVGAGDAVTANLAVAIATDAELPEVLELANRAASVVIHKLGTTGTASVEEIRPC